jgi:Protein of unknown function (DUF1189)
MKTYGLLRAIPMSFYSADLYCDVGRSWKGTGFVYLALLLALCWLPSGFRTHAGLHRFAADDVPKMTADLPEIQITDGVMESRPHGRYEFREANPRPDRPAATLIIDDTIDEAPSEIPPGTIMLTRRELSATRTDRVERRIFTLSAFGDIDVTPQKVRGFLSSLQFWWPPLAYVAGLIGSLIFRVLQACLYATLTQRFARGKLVSLDFRAALRIAAVAVTPVIVLRTLIWFLPTEPSWYIRWPIAIIVTILYLRFAVAALAAEPMTAPEISPV